MRVLDDMCDMLEDELKQIVKKDDINPQELDNAYKAIDILKDIETIKAMQRSEYSYENSNYSQQNSNNYSQRMPYSYDEYSMYNGGGSNNYGSNRSYESNRSYDSYARGGRDGDGDGRYSENRSRGYSRHDEREQLMSKIEELERKVGKMN